MPTTSLSKAYNYRLWIVYLNTRYNISYPFRHLLCFKMTVVWCIWRTLFLKGVYLSFCLKKVTFFEKKCFFFLLVTPILPVSSPLLPITLTLDCKQCTAMLVFQCFKESRDLPYLFFKNGNIKKTTENLTQIQYIFVQYSDPNSQLFYNFINLLSIYTHFSGN